MNTSTPQSWNGRSFLQGMGATATAIAFSACDQQLSRNPKGLSEAALEYHP